MEDIVWVHLKEVLERYGDYFCEKARQNLLQDGSNASGSLAESIVVDKITIDEASYSVTVSLNDYWYYVENGRQAGKFPPISKIEEWVKVKKILPKVYDWGKRKKTVPTVKQLAFLIARKIARKGTKGTKFFSRAKDFTMEHFADAISYAVSEDIAEYVKNSLAKELKTF